MGFKKVSGGCQSTRQVLNVVELSLTHVYCWFEHFQEEGEEHYGTDTDVHVLIAPMPHAADEVRAHHHVFAYLQPESHVLPLLICNIDKCIMHMYCHQERVKKTGKGASQLALRMPAITKQKAVKKVATTHPSMISIASTSPYTDHTSVLHYQSHHALTHDQFSCVIPL